MFASNLVNSLNYIVLECVASESNTFFLVSLIRHIGVYNEFSIGDVFGISPSEMN